MRIAPDRLDTTLDALARSTAGSDQLDAALTSVVDSLRHVFSVTGAGLMLVDAESQLHYVAATDTAAETLERVQEESGVGPCIDAFLTGSETSTVDILVDGRYGEIAETVAAVGIRAVLGVPVRVGAVSVGSLNVYCHEPYDWDDSERDAIQRYARLLGSLLEAALSARQRGQIVEHLQRALDHRVSTERAIGFLMGRDGLDARAAFDRLRRVARSQRRTVREVSEELQEQSVEA
jgi:GAF domain-containing protein